MGNTQGSPQNSVVPTPTGGTTAGEGATATGSSNNGLDDQGASSAFSRPKPRTSRTAFLGDPPSSSATSSAPPAAVNIVADTRMPAAGPNNGSVIQRHTPLTGIQGHNNNEAPAQPGSSGNGLARPPSPLTSPALVVPSAGIPDITAAAATVINIPSDDAAVNAGVRQSSRPPTPPPPTQPTSAPTLPALSSSTGIQMPDALQREVTAAADVPSSAATANMGASTSSSANPSTGGSSRSQAHAGRPSWWRTVLTGTFWLGTNSRLGVSTASGTGRRRLWSRIPSLQHTRSTAVPGGPVLLELDLSHKGIRVRQPGKQPHPLSFRRMWELLHMLLEAIHDPSGASGSLVRRGVPLGEALLYFYDVVSDGILAKNLLSNGYNRMGSLVLLFMLWHYVPTYLMVLHAVSQAFFVQKSLLPTAVLKAAGLLDVGGGSDVSGGALLSIMTTVLDLLHMFLYTLLVIFGLPLLPFMDMYMVLTAVVLPASKPGHVMRAAESICRHYERIRLPLECVMESLPQTGLQMYLYMQTRAHKVAAAVQVSQGVLIASLVGSIVNLAVVSFELYMSYRVSGCSLREYLVALIKLQGYTKVPIEVETALTARADEKVAGIRELDCGQASKEDVTSSSTMQQTSETSTADEGSTNNTSQSSNSDPRQVRQHQLLLQLAHRGGLPNKLVLRIGGQDDAVYQALSSLARRTFMDMVAKKVKLHEVRALHLRQLEPAAVSRLLRAAHCLPSFLKLEGDWRPGQKGISAAPTYSADSYVDVVSKLLPAAAFEMYMQHNPYPLYPLVDFHLSKLQLVAGADLRVPSATRLQGMRCQDSTAIGQGLGLLLMLEPHLTWIMVDRCDIDAHAMLKGMDDTLHAPPDVLVQLQKPACGEVAQSAGGSVAQLQQRHPTLVVVHPKGGHELEEMLTERAVSSNDRNAGGSVSAAGGLTGRARPRELHLVPGCKLLPESFSDTQVMVVPCPPTSGLLEIVTPLMSTVNAPKVLDREQHGPVFNELKKEDAAVVGICLSVNASVESLNLRSTGLVRSSLQYLLHGIKVQSCLTSIDLSHNILGDRGTEDFAEALDFLPCLTALSLDACGIEDNGANALASHILATGAMTRLSRLSLHNNERPMGTAGMEWVCFSHGRQHARKPAKHPPDNHLKGYSNIPAFGLPREVQQFCINFLESSNGANATFATAVPPAEPTSSVSDSDESCLPSDSDEPLLGTGQPSRRCRVSERSNTTGAGAGVMTSACHMPGQSDELRVLDVPLSEFPTWCSKLDCLVMAAITAANTSYPVGLRVRNWLVKQKQERPWWSAQVVEEEENVDSSCSSRDSDSEYTDCMDGALPHFKSFPGGLSLLLAAVSGSLLGLNCKQVHSLDLSRVNLSVSPPLVSDTPVQPLSAIAHLCKGLCNNTAIRRLSLVDCNLNDEAVVSLCKQLQSCSNLEHLQLHGNTAVGSHGVLDGIVPLLQHVKASMRSGNISHLYKKPEVLLTATFGAEASGDGPSQLHPEAFEKLLDKCSTGFGVAATTDGLPNTVYLKMVSGNPRLDDFVMDLLHHHSPPCSPGVEDKLQQRSSGAPHEGSCGSTSSRDVSIPLQSDHDALCLSLAIVQCPSALLDIKALDLRCGARHVLSGFAAESVVKALLSASRITCPKPTNPGCSSTPADNERHLLKLGPASPSSLLLLRLVQLSGVQQGTTDHVEYKATLAGCEIPTSTPMQWDCELASGTSNVDDVCSLLEEHTADSQPTANVRPVCPGVSLKTIRPENVMAILWAICRHGVALRQKTRVGPIPLADCIPVATLLDSLCSSRLQASTVAVVPDTESQNTHSMLMPVLVEACQIYDRCMEAAGVSSGANEVPLLVTGGTSRRIPATWQSQYNDVDAAAFTLALIPGGLGLHHRLDFASSGLPLSLAGLSILLRLLPWHRYTLKELSLAGQSAMAPAPDVRAKTLKPPAEVLELQKQLCLVTIPALAHHDPPKHVQTCPKGAGSFGLQHLNVSGCGLPVKQLAEALKAHTALKSLWVGHCLKAAALRRLLPKHVVVRSTPPCLERQDISARPATKSEQDVIDLCKLGGELQSIEAALEDVTLNPNGTNSDGCTALHVAVKAGHLQAVELLLRAGAKVNLPEESQDRDTPLHLACAGGKLAIVKLLIQEGADTAVGKGDQKTPLHMACGVNSVEVMKLIIHAGADIDAMDEHKETPLHEASSCGNVDAVELLIEKGACVDALNNAHCTPLHIAIHRGHLEVVKALVRARTSASLSIKGGTQDPYTPLLFACSYGHEDIVEELVNAGADVNSRSKKRDQTALDMVCRSGCTKAVQMLLQAGAEVDARDPVKRTALHLASREGHVDAVKLLLEAGADVNAADQDKDTPLYTACSANQAAVVQELIKWKADMEAVNRESCTPLEVASKGGFTDVVKVLLQNGADVNVGRREKEPTPLHIACQNGHMDIVELLLQAGADLTAVTERGTTPLHYASANGYAKVVILLLAKGADVNKKNRKKGWSALHYACDKGDQDTVEVLLQAGADPTVKSHDGMTPQDVAEECDHSSIVKLLSSTS